MQKKAQSRQETGISASKHSVARQQEGTDAGFTCGNCTDLLLHPTLGSGVGLKSALNLPHALNNNCELLLSLPPSPECQDSKGTAVHYHAQTLRSCGWNHTRHRPCAC